MSLLNLADIVFTGNTLVDRVYAGAVQVWTTVTPVVISDEFNSAALNTSLWTVVGPSGAGETAVEGGGELLLSIPTPGEDHDAYQTDKSFGVEQAIDDVDFRVVAKFNDVGAIKYQGNEIMVRQDYTDNWIRFSVYSDGTNLFWFVAMRKGGVTTNKGSAAVTARTLSYLRVTRIGHNWQFDVSPDGVTWQQGLNTTLSYVVQSVGPAITNATPYPTFAAGVDWFRNEEIVLDSYTYDVSATGPGSVVKVPDILEHEYGSLVTVTPTPDTDMLFYKWSGDVSLSKQYDDPLEVNVIEDAVVVGEFGPEVDPVISLWYGPDQEFGNNGDQDKWINILGDVWSPIGITSLTYTHSGGGDIPVAIGSDLRRNYFDGDFNITELEGNFPVGTTPVTITATDLLGGTTDQVVNVVKVSVTATLPRTVTWDDQLPLQDQAQVLDGRWSVTPDGVVADRMGYDRLLYLGDETWTDYEVLAKITLRDWVVPGEVTSGNPMVGIGLRWDGHIPWGSEVPPRGWEEAGAFAWAKLADYAHFSLLDASGSPKNDISGNWIRGETFWFRARVETTTGDEATYSFSKWKDGDTEPVGWDATIDTVGNAQNGGLLLLAHHVDATFHDIEVTGL